MIEKDENELNYKQKKEYQQTERDDDYVETTSMSDAADEPVIRIRESVPDPFVFPVRSKPYDFTAAWQKRRANFQQKLRS